MKKDKEYFENNYFNNFNEQDGNGWGFNWRASQKKRMDNSIKFIEKILKKKDLAVLEAGCATADMTKLLYKRIKNLKKYDAFDISDKAIEICKSNIHKGINWMVCDLTEMDFDKNTYDLIICSEAIYYLKFYQQRKCIEKFHSYLKDGGFLFVSMPYSEYKEIFSLFLKEFRREKVFYNKNWLWTKIECKLLIWHNQTANKDLKKFLRSIISNEKIMEIFYRINIIFLPNKIQHIFLLLQK